MDWARSTQAESACVRLKQQVKIELGSYQAKLGQSHVMLCQVNMTLRLVKLCWTL